MNLPKQSLCAFLTFNGNAEKAMRFYEAKLPGMKIESLTLFDENTPDGNAGTVLNGVLSFRGESILFLDMAPSYPAPAFSWSTSLLINCANEAEFDALFAGISEEGFIMMGPEPILDMRKCTWVTDKFGVTWQLVWE